MRDHFKSVAYSEVFWNDELMDCAHEATGW